MRTLVTWESALHLIRPRFARPPSPQRGRLEGCAIQRLPLAGKLSAARLTDEVFEGTDCRVASLLAMTGQKYDNLLFAGFCGSKSDARYNCGQGRSCANLKLEVSPQTGSCQFLIFYKYNLNMSFPCLFHRSASNNLRNRYNRFFRLPFLTVRFL